MRLTSSLEQLAASGCRGRWMNRRSVQTLADAARLSMRARFLTGDDWAFAVLESGRGKTDWRCGLHRAAHGPPRDGYWSARTQAAGDTPPKRGGSLVAQRSSQGRSSASRFTATIATLHLHARASLARTTNVDVACDSRLADRECAAAQRAAGWTLRDGRPAPKT